ncbi:MAG: acetyl-CoA acetyltransferase [Actinomycetota bacterium]
MSDRTPVIAGVAESDLGVTGRTILELHAQGIVRALDDAGLALRDVDALFATGVSRFSAALLAEYLGIRPVWTESSMGGGASYEIFAGHAAEAIRAGRCEVALLSYGNNQRSARSRKLGGVIDEHAPEAQFEAPYGPLNPISLYAMAAQRHMHEFGTTPEQLAEVAVAARAWALRNPAAFRHGDGTLSVEDVLSSPTVSTPLHALDCCLITAGGGAVVMTTAERARDLKRIPVAVLGHGEETTNNGMSQIPDLTAIGAQASGARAYAMAGLGPGEVDVVQVYDSFTITVLLELEALGFCGRGEAGAFVQKGRIAPGGEFPLNTSGGGLSYCHPGIFGLLLLVEAVRQLRGECGERQVPGARVALCHGTGGILSTHSTVILGVHQ